MPLARQFCFCPFWAQIHEVLQTQGVALGYVSIGLSARPVQRETEQQTTYRKRTDPDYINKYDIHHARQQRAG